MSIIRPLKPRQERHVCPDCRAPEGLFIGDDRKVTCKLCGWQDSQEIGAISANVPEESTSESVIKPLSPNEEAIESVIKPLSSDEKPAKDIEDIRDLRQFKVTTFAVRNPSTITVWGGAAYDSGLVYVRRRMWDDAIKAFQRAIDMDHDFVEAHLWLGRLLLDEKKQRDHLSYAIGYMNQSSEAVLEVMYLDGRISLSQLENALYSGEDIQLIEASVPVESETVILSCPVCGGHMTTHPITGHVECAYCGHIEDSAPAELTKAGESLTAALLHQQAEGIKWIIGERIIHCNNCGAARTIPKEQMGTHCLYCGSQHIIVQDALNSFRQPDGIVPFSIPQEQADQAIQDRLFENWERFKGMFINNKVKQATLTGTYLPFWVFDVMLEVNLSYQDQSNYTQPTRRDTHAESFRNYAFPAVLSPAPLLIEKINHFDLSKIQPYEASTLARYPAEIYQIDFDKASLEVRGRIRQALTRKYKTTQLRSGDLMNIWSTMRQITFQLVLLPVWVATLIEDDDDIRIGLVNGQTGEAVLGKARKPDKYRMTNGA